VKHRLALGAARAWIVVLGAALACGAPPSLARAQAPDAEPAPIPIAEITARASAEQEALAALRAQVQELGNITPLEGGLQAVRLETRQRKEVLSGQLARSSGFDALLRLQGIWAELAQRVGGWESDFTRRAGSVEARLAEVDTRWQLWRATYQKARDQDAPEVVLLAARATRDALAEATPEVTAVRDRLLKAQSTAGQLRSEIEASLGQVTAKQAELLSTILVRDQPPLWSAGESEDVAQIHERVRTELQTQLDATVSLAR
jgi:hypothetical protein